MEEKKISWLRIVSWKRREQFGTICPLIYQNGKALGELGTPAFQKERNASWKVQREAAVARTKIETRRPFAVMLSNRAGTSLQAVWGCELDLTFSRGGDSVWALRLRLSPTLFLPLPFPQSSPEPGKESLGNIHTRLAVVCRDTDTMKAPFTLPLPTPLFKAKWCWLHLCGLASVRTNLEVHICIAHEAEFGMFEVPFRKIPTQWPLIICETSMKVKRQK